MLLLKPIILGSSLYFQNNFNLLKIEDKDENNPIFKLGLDRDISFRVNLSQFLNYSFIYLSLFICFILSTSFIPFFLFLLSFSICFNRLIHSIIFIHFILSFIEILIIQRIFPISSVLFTHSILSFLSNCKHRDFFSQSTVQCMQ